MRSSISSNRLVAAMLEIVLMLFLITASYGSPIQQQSTPPPVAALMTPRATSDSNNFTFPTAFNTLGDNFTTSSCPTFFSDFLSNPTYKSCYPVSLLLQNSNAFFKDLSSTITLDEVLDTACSANITSCSTYMAKLASNLTSTDNCGADYKLGNPVVTQAYDGMKSYEPIAKSVCLVDPSTQDFCFTEAATNTSDSSNYYLYFIALGNSLPGGSRPSCSQCTEATMSVFLDAALIAGSPLTTTYISAAETINEGCGPDFVNATAKVGSESASSSSDSSAVKVPSLTMIFAYLLPICMGMVFLV